MRRKLANGIVTILLGVVLLAGGSPALAEPPDGAVTAAVANAAGSGVTSFISVVDRTSGAVVGQTANAGAQVASESIMKLFLAAYYLRLYGGWTSTPQSVLDRLSYMLRFSDDGTASALFTESAIPTVAARYGLGSTINATDRPGHWGAARITASDMTRFLFAAFNDPAVGPWLEPVMTQTAPNGSGADAQFSQLFGLNALSGVHGSKQGWGCDSFWTSPQCAVHSVGYTDRYFVAVLQLGGYPDPMRATSTKSATLIQQARMPLVNGDFICDSSTGAVYRIAGGAPVYVSTWSAFGGPRPCVSMTTVEIGRLPKYPADGTFIRATSTGAVYRIAGGAPLYLTTWTGFGDPNTIVNVDTAAIDLAGTGGVFNHLRYYPADGTFIRATSTGAVYRIAGGAPLYLTTWTGFGDPNTIVNVDTAAIDLAGTGGVFNHLRYYPADGTFIRATSTGAVYRIAGGAPLYLTTWTGFGDPNTIVNVDTAAIDLAGTGGVFNHLRYYPADGTFIRATSTGAVYRIAGGAPLYLTTWTGFGDPNTIVNVDTAAIDLAGTGGVFNHLRYYPADGTFIRATSTGAVYRIAGGAPLYLTTWTGFGDPNTIVNVDTAAIDLAGTGGVFNHLRYYPADGTFLAGLPGERIHRVANRTAVYVPSWTPFGGVQPSTSISQPTIDLAGTGGVFNHLVAGP